MVYDAYDSDVIVGRNLPRNKYYLAASVSDLKQIMNDEGDEHAVPMQLSSNIAWHNISNAFKPCHCSGIIRTSHSNRVQVLLNPRSRFGLHSGNMRVDLRDGVAAVFGHNKLFKFFYRNLGDPREGEPSMRSEQSESDLRVSGLGTSMGLTSSGTQPGSSS